MENTLLKMAGPKSLLTDAWRSYKANFAGLIKVSLIPMIAVTLISFIAAFFGILSLPETAPAEAGTPTIAALSMPVILMLLVGLVIIICVSLWGQVAILSAVIKTDSGPINIKAAFQQGWQLLPPYIWITLITIVILIPAFALLVIPGIWLSIAFTFTSYILVVENQRGFAAIKASYNYVKNYWFAVFGRMIVLMIIVMIPTIIVTMPFEKNSISGSIANAVISLLVTPYAILYMYGMYKNLRSIKSNAAQQLS